MNSSRPVAILALVLILNLTMFTAPAKALLLTQIAGEAGSRDGEVTAITIHREWRVTCHLNDDNRQCRMETAATTRTGDDDAISVSLAGEMTEQGRLLFFFTTPLDLLVANGIEMRVDNGRTMRLAYRSCHQAGCLVPFQPDPQLENSLRRGTTLNVRLFDLENRPIDIELSLMGFTASVGQLRQR